MGSGSTKFLSFDEASKRFSQNDLERIETSFRELTVGTNELDHTNFKRDVFANFLPEKLANRLFQIFTNSSRSGMTYKELICCLALIYNGTEKERMQLLYAIFTQTGVLYWYNVEEFLRQCGDQLPDELKNFFQKTEIITQEKFLKWLEYHQGHTTTIIDWLMDEQCLHELSTFTIDRIYDQYSILSGVTHLSEKEIKELEQSYYQLHRLNYNKQQQISSQIFSNILSPVIPPVLIEGVFEAFDENRDGSIDFKEFICGISAACRGPQFQRYKFLFRVFDRDHDGILNHSDVIYMTSCLIEVAQFVYVADIHINTSPEIYADTILPENETILKLEDFLTWCQKDRLMVELLDLIFQISHVVLGLRPTSEQDEVTIVKYFLRREKYPFNQLGTGNNRASSKPGALWFLIAMEWWLKWESLCSSSIVINNELKNKKTSTIKPNKIDNRNEPGDIDNSSLIEKIISNDCVQLKPNLRDGIHFEMIPEFLWLFLRKYYRCIGPVVCRKVTYRKGLNKPELDLYPLIIKIYRNQILSPQQMQTIATNNNNNNSSQSMYSAYPLVNYLSASMFGSNNSSTSVTSNTPRHYLVCSYFVSHHQTVRSFAEDLSIKFGKSLEELRLWMKYNETDLRQIDFESIDEVTCQEAGINSNSEILLEIRNNDLTWPEELYTLATRSKALTLSINNSIGNIEEEGRGQIGLSNLGNTCFLNAAVQCLSHSFPLTYYFLYKYHLFEINKDNPIGMQGNIAISYGQLITKLWGNVRGPLAPFELRGSVAKFGSSRFTDFQQHDSQEFLAFLLDGLHEDLNRVYEKPYVELKDSDDRPDEDVAHEYWLNHLSRNTSIVVDLFHGLLRSQVKCRICELKSVRFDPFNILSLPLPIDNSVYIEVKLIRLDGSKPVRYGIKLDGELPVDQIKKQLSILSSLPIEQIGFFDVTSPSCLRRYTVMDYNQTRIKQLNIRDFVAYELPLNNSNGQLNYLIAIHRRLEKQERYLSPLTRYKTSFFGQPIIISYENTPINKITNKNIYENISKQLERLLRKNTDASYISNHALDCDDSLGQRYPFILKHVKDDGKHCIICPWNRCCLGCSFDSNDNEFLYTGGNIAIEWESSAYYLRYLSNREQDVEIHSSVKVPRTWSNNNNNSSNTDDSTSMITLEDCLESFINWENLDNKEMFSCKRCKQLQPADKKLDIWKLPPCLIFHIKRFQLSNNRWIKSSRPVRFPIRSFHPSKYLAQRSSTTNSLATSPTEDNLSVSSSSLSSLTTTTTAEVASISSNDNNTLILSPARLINGNNSYSQSNSMNSGLPPPESLDETLTKKKKRFGGRRKKSEIENSNTSISYPPKFLQTNDRTISFGDNSFDADNAAYNLYAFICHYGVIGGGHYVAFVKNHINQQWYCFNDSSCKPVSENVLSQCSSSAYLLFYERESLDHRCYMPNVQGKTQVPNELSLSADDRWCSLM